jgi:uncharacterized membrane protein
MTSQVTPMVCQRRALLPLGLVFGLLTAATAGRANEAFVGGPDVAAVRPVVARYCLDCHTGDSAEGEVELSFIHDAASLGRHAKVLQRVADMVTTGQMPPPESDQPTDDERRALADWLRAFLAA